MAIMARKILILGMVLMFVVAFGTAPVMAKATKAQIKAVKAEMEAFNAQVAAAKARGVAAGQRQAKFRAAANQAGAETVANSVKEKAAMANSAAAAKVSATAKAEQDKFCKVIGFIPGVGLSMRLYNSGEMKACLAGLGNESYYGVKHAFFKLPASLPEHAAPDFLYQFTGSDWRELDPITVFLVDGRPYWMDCFVIGAKIAMPILAAYPAASGLPILATRGEVIGNAFLWQAAVGGGLNVVAGTGYQAATGFKAYRQYYKDFQWWTGKPATVGAFI